MEAFEGSHPLRDADGARLESYLIHKREIFSRPDLDKLWEMIGPFLSPAKQMQFARARSAETSNALEKKNHCRDALLTSTFRARAACRNESAR